MLARLVLENGKIFYGKGFGAEGASNGEVVFNTAMTGYQEVLTDPSYCGQIVTMTYPLIGNYGINPDDFESRRPFVRGFIVREACTDPNNWRTTETLSAYLERNGIVGLTGIDTRALTRIIRQFGTLRGIITTQDFSDAELLQRVLDVPTLSGQNLLDEVTTPEPYTLAGPGKRIVVVDLGMKRAIARNLNKAGCEVVVVPSHTSATDILALNPDGLMLSNGPGDPKDAVHTISEVKKLVGKLPMFGICLGHQVLALALGGDTYKLKFGHRGANHPVKDLQSTKVQITSQNHGYAINEEKLKDLDVTVTHRNLNDGTVEGMVHNKYPIFCVQYHPEAFPGPSDSAHIFERFLSMMEAN
ncbi:MAG: glutamine-hydrolyzing carbamoyl-phosphate synthase small subunit [Clostridiales bacterium]|jgi:carbamoyl-phosphate synthase small subunit|nr:glutamine-hydrolyzing carbamoyl-phosphate synthase small subunit [Clostridiales bacterium]